MSVLPGVICLLASVRIVEMMILLRTQACDPAPGRAADLRFWILRKRPATGVGARVG